MAESLAALGVAANIVQFVELGFKVTKSIIETYRNIDTEGLAARHVDLSAITTSLKERCTKLQNDAGVQADTITMGLLRRCDKIADELLSQLKSLTIATGKRDQRWVKFVISVKAIWNKSNIEGLHSRMMDVKTELFGRLESLIYEARVSMSTSDAMLSLGEASAAWNNAIRQRLGAMANELRDLLRSGSEADPAQMLSFADTLSKFADESKKQGTIKDILVSLKFAQIKERQNEILRAHKNTFEWLFEESSEVNFRAWLKQSKKGVFWITGKPGSGKSTLMKFISSHPKTVPLAREWSGSKSLVIASHFFWSVGSQLQRSQEGLLRTILFQILVHCPEIIPEVCSRRYSNPFLALETWSIEELSESFDKLHGIDELLRRVLLLVDGLDEHRGDHETLVTFLSAIAQSSDIKVCCASRPWAQFEKAFGGAPWQFEMQRLTRNDMKLFVHDSLGQHPRFRELQSEQRDSSERLIQTIFDKAEGVFFWVSLVVKSILRGLSNQDVFEVLQRRLSELPSDLYQFFQRMLDSIEDVYRDKAKLDFAILLSSSASLPLDVFLALDRLPSSLKRLKATHGIKTSSVDTIPDLWEFSETTSTVAVNLSRKQKRDQVLARCRDLVQSWQVDGEDSRGIRIGFLHRTVVDFLREADFLQLFKAQITCGPRYLLVAALCSCCFDNGRYSVKANSDFLLRIFHCIEEADPDELRRDGEHLVEICDALFRCYSNWENRQMFELQNDDTLPLAAQAVSRLLTTQPSLYKKFRQTQARWFDKLIRKRLVSFILEGYISIEVGDYATYSRSDLIDLELLEGLIRTDEEDSMIEFDWLNFVTRLNHRPHPRPRNIFQACQLLIRHGAKRHISLPLHVEYDYFSWVSGWRAADQRQVDVLLDVFQQKGIFNADEVNELAGLFPPEIEINPDSEEKLYVPPVSRFWRLLSWVKGA